MITGEKQSLSSAPRREDRRTGLEMPLEVIREEQAVMRQGVKGGGYNAHQYDTRTTKKAWIHRVRQCVRLCVRVLS